MKKASDIYKKQNTIIHRAFNAFNLPYKDNKDGWLSLCRSICGRQVNGLSDLDLLERGTLIRNLAARGLKLFNPGVPLKMRDWKKEDPDIIIGDEHGPRNVQPGKRRMIAKVGAILADLGHEWSYADGISKQMFKIDKVEWCEQGQLYKVVQALVYQQKKESEVAC